MKIQKHPCFTLLLSYWAITITNGFSVFHSSSFKQHNTLFHCPRFVLKSKSNSNPSHDSVRIVNNKNVISNRRNVMFQTSQKGAAALAFGLLVTNVTVQPQPVQALVKGVAPPPPKKKSENGKKCSNVEECQEMAEKLAAEEEARIRALPPPLVAERGTRYRDVVVLNNEGSSSVALGDNVSIRYKVLKLGKRSYDGISGEGTVVFSRGFGLEDDEKEAGTTSFDFQVGDPRVISALNDAIIGMQPGGIRRLSVLPQMGWEKPIKACDGGPGGAGNGGELKTDYVIVPTATMVATETCFDTSKLPYPQSYAQQRRMAQRFDQSLLMEVELVNKK